MVEAESVISEWVTSYPCLRLAPPLIAIGLAICLKEVNFALLTATFCGCLLLTDFAVFQSINDLCDVVMRQIADGDHTSTILFTVLLGAMIRLMSDSGGTASVVTQISHFANSRRRGQVITWLAGLIIFFDDYASTMLVGGSARSLCDRLKISRAKLAFIIDATAAPIAGMALSTWTLFEIGRVEVGLSEAGIDANATSVFLSTIPYRVYPILAIVAVGVIAASNRDFGPMLKAERDLEIPDNDRDDVADELPEESSLRLSMFAVIPILTLVTCVWIGYSPEADSYRLLVLASLAASTVAVILPAVFARLTWAECSAGWARGITSMIPAIIVLTLAWSISDVCDSEKLNTAGYIVSLVGDAIRPELLPAVAFIVAGAVAVSVGSSFATMSLLLPMFIPVTWNVLVASDNAVTVNDPVFLSTVGAILAGAIFGDHCSPISDTTVLSSAAAGCDHLQHVATQLPYAIVIATSSILFGYLPIGFGVPWWIALPISGGVCIGVILFLGKSASEDGAQ